ncbi:MAG: ABC transporter permease [Armatimonadetes bacterium]|nr:ABC transporter permease [Armatimonadota bacterium]
MKLSFSFRRMSAVTRKEFQELVRNWMGFLLSIVSPIILYFLFAYGMPLDVKNIPMVVLDEDKSSESRALIDVFTNSQVFELRRMVGSSGEVDRIMRLGEIRVCLVIPSDFSRKIRQGMRQEIQVLVDATYPNRAAIMAGYVDAALADFSETRVKALLVRVMGGGGEGGLPVSMLTSAWFNPTLRSEDFIVPGVIAIMLIFLPPILAAISISKEKETGSIINMLCSPVSKAEYLVGKMIPYIVITYGNFLLFLLFTVTIFKVPLRGDLFLLLGVSLIYAVSVIGIGLLVAVLVGNQISAILIVAVATLIPSFMYSGFLLPTICMDSTARTISQILPPTHYIDFIRKLMIKGVGVLYLQSSIVMLILIALVLFGLSIALFKKKLS